MIMIFRFYGPHLGGKKVETKTEIGSKCINQKCIYAKDFVNEWPKDNG